MSDFENIHNQLPYNPSDVDIRQQTFSVNSLINRIAHGEIELWREKDYQRKSNSWSPSQRSRLIESLIMRIPLPIFYFDGSEMPWKVIDGLHRLTTLYTFLRGQSFELAELEYLKKLEGLTFNELPFQYKRALEESTIEAYVINPGTPDRVKLNIFQRINTGGSRLSRQEIRNAYYRGLPVDFIDELATSPEFLKATNGKIKPDRMKDREAVLRFFSFFKFLENYNPPMERFLDVCMEKIDDMPSELGSIRERFFDSMITCKEIFGDNAFYTLNIHGQKQSGSINIALFEAWSVNLAHIDKNTLSLLCIRKEQVINGFINLIQDVEFHKSFTSSTSSKRAVEIRFSSIRNLITDIVKYNA